MMMINIIADLKRKNLWQAKEFKETAVRSVLEAD